MWPRSPRTPSWTGSCTTVRSPTIGVRGDRRPSRGLRLASAPPDSRRPDDRSGDRRHGDPPVRVELQDEEDRCARQGRRDEQHDQPPSSRPVVDRAPDELEPLVGRFRAARRRELGGDARSGATGTGAAAWGLEFADDPRGQLAPGTVTAASRHGGADRTGLRCRAMTSASAPCRSASPGLLPSQAPEVLPGTCDRT